MFRFASRKAQGWAFATSFFRGSVFFSKGRQIMQTIGAKEAKDRFSDLLQSVQREPVSILRNGRPAASWYPRTITPAWGDTPSVWVDSWRIFAAR